MLACIHSENTIWSKIRLFIATDGLSYLTKFSGLVLCASSHHVSYVAIRLSQMFLFQVSSRLGHDLMSIGVWAVVFFVLGIFSRTEYAI